MNRVRSSGCRREPAAFGLLLLGCLSFASTCAGSDLGDLIRKSPLPLHLPALPTGLSLPKDPDGLSTSLDDTYASSPHVPYSFVPSEQPAQDARVSPDGRLLIGTGYYDFHLRSFCLHAGLSRPRARGDGYLMAPLKGQRAGIIDALLRRSVGAADIPQAQLQVLIWAILSGTTLPRMPAEERAVARRLLHPEELQQISGGWKELIPDPLKQRLLQQAQQAVPDSYSRAVSAYLALRNRLESGSAAYAELEAIAAPEGDAVGPRSRAVNSGEWTARSGGYYLRYLPSGYSETEVQIYRPLTPSVHRSDSGRVTSIDYLDGRRLTIDYSPVTYVYVEPATQRRYRFWTIRTAHFDGPTGRTSFDAHLARVWSVEDLLTPTVQRSSWHLPLLGDAKAAALNEYPEEIVTVEDIERVAKLKEYSDLVKDSAELSHGIGELMHPTPNCNLQAQLHELASGKALLGALKGASGIDGKLGGTLGAASGFIDYVVLVERIGVSEARILAGGCDANAPGSTIGVDLPAFAAVPGNTGRQRLGLSLLPRDGTAQGSAIQLQDYKP